MAGSDAGLALERELSKLQTFPTLAGHGGPVLHPLSPAISIHTRKVTGGPPQQRKWKNIGGRISRKAVKLYDAQVGYTRTTLLSFPRFYPLSPQVLLYNTGWMQSRAPFPLTTVPPLPHQHGLLNPAYLGPRASATTNTNMRRLVAKGHNLPRHRPGYRRSGYLPYPSLRDARIQCPKLQTKIASLPPTGIGLREPPK